MTSRFPRAHVEDTTPVGVAHFVMISYWESYDAIRAFAGEDLDRAWLHGDDSRFDLDPDLFVTHHQVAPTA